MEVLQYIKHGKMSQKKQTNSLCSITVRKIFGGNKLSCWSEHKRFDRVIKEET